MKITETEFIVHKAKNKDPDAFSELIQIYKKDMYQVAYSILMNNEDVADAVQDTILSCWEKINKLRQDQYFKAWMLRILINKCNDICRQKKREMPSEILEEQVLEDAVNIEWEEALQLLDEKYRVVVVLYYKEEYSIKEIAKLLHLPGNTVSTRLRRAREKLKNYYEL